MNSSKQNPKPSKRDRFRFSLPGSRREEDGGPGENNNNKLGVGGRLHHFSFSMRDNDHSRSSAKGIPASNSNPSPPPSSGPTASNTHSLSSSATSTGTSSWGACSANTPEKQAAHQNYDMEFTIPTGPFSSPDSEENIKFEEQLIDGLPVVKAATLEKLVERVTYQSYPDVKYMTQFLLTYRSFTSAPALLDLLSERSNLPIPRDLTEEEEERFQKKVQQPVRLRVLNLLKSWVNQYTHDFVDDPEFSDDFSQFLDKLGAFEGMNLGAKTLKMQLKKKSQKISMGGEEEGARKTQGRGGPPKSYEPSFKGRGANLLEINPTELARQLTLHESKLFRKIKPWEFLNQAWAKKGGLGAPNVLEMIHWSTKVSGFVATEIMRAPINKKVRVITYFMQVAAALRDLNNFNALMEVIAGFENAAVWRLQPFFNEVPRKNAHVMDELRVTMSTQKNNKSIREALRSVDMPCIPYLGMFLTDLTFIEDGNSDSTKEGLINFTKRRYVAQVILEIQQYQQIGYCLNPVRIIHQYLSAFRNWDDEKLYKVSLQFMPRSAKDKSVKELEALYNETEKEIKAARKKEADEDIDWGPLEDPDYPFNEKDTPDNVVVDERGALMAGSLPKLIQRLAGRPTPGFMETFLVTWPTFCSAEEFSRLLLLRFNPPNPKDEKKLEDYQKKVVMTVKTRVVNILKSFVEKFSFHFVGNPELAKIFFPLLERVHETSGVLAKTVKKVEESLTKLTSQEANSNIERPFSNGPAYTPGPSNLTPRSPRPSSSPPVSPSHKLQGIRGHEQAFAKTLTVLHHRIFLMLGPQSLLSLRQNGEILIPDQSRKEEMTAFLQQYVKAERFCYDFVVSKVVTPHSPNERVQLIESFISICEICLSHYDYCTAGWVMNGLSSKTLRNLPLTWSAVSPAQIEKFKKIQKETRDFNKVHHFRESTYEPGNRFVKPCIPPVSSYINSFLAVLAVPEHEKGLINFSKREGMASLVTDLMKLQKISYEFEMSEEVERFISFQERRLKVKGEVVNRCNAVMNEENSPGKNTNDIYLPPEAGTPFNDFANRFLCNHTLFELNF